MTISATGPFLVDRIDLFGLVTNSGWNSGRGGFAGLSALSGSISFTFSELVSGVGGFLNYAVSPGSPQPDTVLSIYDSADALIESFNITADAPISTPGVSNAGAFRGFDVGSATIKRFELSNAGVVIDDLTIAGVAAPDVPPPAAGVLLLGALGALGVVRRRG